MFDCHVHSSFSGDSDMDSGVACEKAVEKGLRGIVFTDHYDEDYPDYNENFLIEFDDYSKHMALLKEQFKGRLNVLMGVEAGIQPHVIEKICNVVSTYEFDFVIASIHIIDRMDPYAGAYYQGKTKEQAFSRYLEEILHCSKLYKNYDVLGHIGYVRRYGGYSDNSLRHADHCDVIDEILKTVISDGKGIEVNTSGYRNGLGSPIPDYDIVKRYKELGGEILCLGSDAHYTEHIGADFDKTKANLLDLGFKYLVHYEKRKPVFEKIK